MTDVFLSWGSPDATIARPLVKRLRSDGFDVWEYDTSGVAGENVSEDVRDKIRNAKTVVVLLSPTTKDRPWLVAEFTLAVESRDRGGVRRVILVRLGGVADDDLPDPIRRADVRSFALDDGEGYEAALARLVDDIRTGLGNEGLLLVPTALLAMTRTEFREIFPPDGSRNELLESICARVGMNGNPELRGELEQRYGATAEDFTPFGGTSLQELVFEAQGVANRKRVARGQPRVHLQWLSEADFGQQEIRRKWQSSRSVLMVDSVSTFAPSISARIQNLPQMKEARDLAIVWVPPYTRHTMALENLIQATLRAPSFLADTFDAWRSPDFDIPFLAFDVATTTTLKRWVAQTLDSISPEQRPILSNIESFAGPGPREGVRPSRFYTPDTARSM